MLVGDHPDPSYPVKDVTLGINWQLLASSQITQLLGVNVEAS